MNKKLSDKDKKDWENFISGEQKVQNKDLFFSSIESNKNLVKTIDLHGLSLENANRTIDEFIKSNSDLMKKIKNIKEAIVNDGGSGAFDIFLKNFKE